MIDTAKYGHAQKRSVLAQALGEGALKAMEETILQSVRQFCKLLKDQSQQDLDIHGPDWSSSKDMTVLASRLSFDVMNQVCFGHRSDTLEKEDYRYILDVLSDGVQCLNTVREYLTGPFYLLTTTRLVICSPYSIHVLIRCCSGVFSTVSSSTKHSAVANATDASKFQSTMESQMYSVIYRRRLIPRRRGPFTPVLNWAARAAYSSSRDQTPPPHA